MMIGVFLLLVGTLMFLDNMGIIHYRFGDYVLPVALIALGISFMTDHIRKKR